MKTTTRDLTTADVGHILVDDGASTAIDGVLYLRVEWGRRVRYYARTATFCGGDMLYTGERPLYRSRDAALIERIEAAY